MKKIYAALIAAAGLSSRMGTPKHELLVGNRTFLEHLIDTFHEAKVSPIVVTAAKTELGYVEQERSKTFLTCSQFERVKKMLQSGLCNISKEGFACFILNHFPHLGLLGSLRSALIHLKETPTDGLFMCPIDAPLVSVSLIQTLIEHAQKEPEKPLIVPCFEGKRGHPVLFLQSVFSELKSFESEHGVRDFFKKHPTLIHEVPWNDPSILLNINRPEDYRHLVEQTLHLK